MGFRIAIAAATIGVIYGYDLGAIAGALLFITDEFELSTKQTEWVATIVVAGSVLGALGGGRLANAIGRKPAMVVVALTYAVFAILSGLATSLVFLDVARFFLGVTIGISIVTAPIFVAESAPAAVRGGLVVMYQVATVTADRRRLGERGPFAERFPRVARNGQNPRARLRPHPRPRPRPPRHRCRSPQGPRKRRAGPGHRREAAARS